MMDNVQLTKNSNFSSEIERRQQLDDVETVNFSKEREEQTLIVLQLDKDLGESMKAAGKQIFFYFIQIPSLSNGK